MRAVILVAIRSYQLVVSPWLPPCCRYQPSCSEYALTAVRRFGVLRGSWLMACRLLRCRPLGSFGYDPVPAREV
ncbi:membrane protein insertion efficiency factor YidD [Candidatus Palauibacter sp.]|uniref:membrane protein insertion efficiency factor YidD n=1 Tax=Candidatus Palauibacter sp. TaxID=3101350 RepID=UPI003AF26436